MKSFSAIFILFLFTSIAIAQSTGAELVFQRTEVVVKNGKLTKTHTYEVLINNRGGEEFTDVAIYVSGLAKVSNIEASIKDRFGKLVKKLNRSDIKERSTRQSFSFYEDDMVREFSLKHNDYPYTLSYSYQEQETQFLGIEYWQPVLGLTTPTREALLRLEVPKKYKFTAAENRINPPKTDTLSPDKDVYTWYASYDGKTKSERLSSAADGRLPIVKILPEDFYFEKPGSQKTWVDYGNWQYSLLEGLDDLPESEKAKINKMLEGVVDTKEKIRRLYHYLQDETRYINVSIETGGLKPHPSSYVAQNKYGDCKALTNYFKSVLDYANVASYYTKVFAGDQVRQIDKEVPSQQFNHVILLVPVEKDTLWLDCTSDLAFNYLGTFTQNREVFVVDKDNSRFVRTPALSKNDVLETRKINFKNSEEGTLANFSNTYRGKNYEDLAMVGKQYNESINSTYIRDYFVEKGFELVGYKIQDPPRDSLFVRLDYTARSTNIFNQYGSDIIINVLSFAIPSMEKPGERKSPVQIDFPQYNVDTLTYEVPKNYVLAHCPDNVHIETDIGTYHTEYVVSPELIKIVKSYYLKQGVYSIENYAQFYAFVNQVKNLEMNNKIQLVQKK